ncbi:hypothetical protein KIN20_021712 [Parelaphostrongylus tenuis]|uniref:Uncharacterized protein n=1 Tax=Parelaphostrongylus tenuis TaxID=148309 RepID=A0AAD5N5I5_PARTN|nr:hypothetical protein KIN20_021712 [Parelaphostrongylus tenuis]
MARITEWWTVGFCAKSCAVLVRSATVTRSPIISDQAGTGVITVNALLNASPSRRFLNYGCTIRSLAVSRPNALLMFEIFCHGTSGEQMARRADEVRCCFTMSCRTHKIDLATAQAIVASNDVGCLDHAKGVVKTRPDFHLVGGELKLKG